MISSSKVQCVKIFCTIQLGEYVLNPGHGPDKLLCDSVKGCIINNKAFSTITLEYYYDRG